MKKIFIATVFVFYLIFASTAWAQTVATESSASASEFSDKLPLFIKKPFDAAYNFLETLRLDWKDTLSEKKAALQEKINTKESAISKDVYTQEEADPDTYKEKTYVDSTYGNPINLAFDHILLFLYNVFLFITTSILAFYGVLALILVLILRFIWNHLL